MVVVLDTNIIIQAPRLDGDLHKVLYDYLDKTDSHLIMPDIVTRKYPLFTDGAFLKSRPGTSKPGNNWRTF